jgi:hypothetical protein
VPRRPRYIAQTHDVGGDQTRQARRRGTRQVGENGAYFYESEVDATAKAVTSIIEPLMIVVGGIILAMYLPMFKIYELIE